MSSIQERIHPTILSPLALVFDQFPKIHWYIPQFLNNLKFVPKLIHTHWSFLLNVSSPLIFTLERTLQLQPDFMEHETSNQSFREICQEKFGARVDASVIFLICNEYSRDEALHLLTDIQLSQDASSTPSSSYSDPLTSILASETPSNHLDSASAAIDGNSLNCHTPMQFGDRTPFDNAMEFDGNEHIPPLPHPISPTLSLCPAKNETFIFLKSCFPAMDDSVLLKVASSHPHNPDFALDEILNHAFVDQLQQQQAPSDALLCTPRDARNDFSLAELVMRFPNIDTEVLLELLDNVDGSVERVVEQLTPDFRPSTPTGPSKKAQKPIKLFSLNSSPGFNRSPTTTPPPPPPFSLLSISATRTTPSPSTRPQEQADAYERQRNDLFRQAAVAFKRGDRLTAGGAAAHYAQEVGASFHPPIDFHMCSTHLGEKMRFVGKGIQFSSRPSNPRQQ